jgi:hypothetical protein
MILTSRFPHTDLDFYPLMYHKAKDELREAALKRGRAWKKYLEGQPTVMTFEGEALPLATIHAPSHSGPGRRYNDDTDEADLTTLRASSDSGFQMAQTNLIQYGIPLIEWCQLR